MSHAVPSAPPLDQVGISAAPPSYDEAVGNVVSPPRDQNISNTAQLEAVNEEEKKKEQRKQNPPLNASPPLVTVQPQPQQQTTYNFNQPVYQQAAPPSDCCVVCLWCDGSDIADLCYCIFCCSRHVTGHDAGCCDCGDTCCDCPEGCCECGDCDCDCGDCECSGGDCNCGDCSII